MTRYQKMRLIILSRQNIKKFLMKNLEIITLCFALKFLFNTGFSWKYWLTIILVSISSGISIHWQRLSWEEEISDKEKNKTDI